MKHDPTLYEPRDQRWCHIFSALAGVASSLIQANAAEEAAELQSQAAGEAVQLGREGLSFQQEIFDTSRADLAPWRASGTAALGAMNNMFIPGGQGSVQLHGQLNDLRAQREAMAGQERRPVQSGGRSSDRDAAYIAELERGIGNLRNVRGLGGAAGQGEGGAGGAR